MLKIKEIPDQMKPWLDTFYISVGAETDAQRGAAACAILGCIAGEVTLRMGPHMAADLLQSLAVHAEQAKFKASVIFKA